MSPREELDLKVMLVRTDMVGLPSVRGSDLA